MITGVLVYLVFLAFSILFAVLLNDVTGCTPLFLTIFLPLVSLVYTTVLRFRFTFREQYDQASIVRGELGRLSIEVINDTILLYPHVAASLTCCAPGEKTGVCSTADFSVSPHEMKKIDFDMSLEHIGQYRVGLKAVKFYDLLGLFRLKCRKPLKTITVTPRIIDIDVLPDFPPVKPSQTAASFTTQEKENYSGVREYVPGDSLKNIHWKLTAHCSKYMSRRYENNNRSGVSVFIDLSQPDIWSTEMPSVYDCLVESAMSVAASGLCRNQGVCIVFNAGKTVSTLLPESVGDIQPIAARFATQYAFQPPDGKLSASEMLRNAAENRSFFENIVVCTACLTNDLVTTMALMSVNGCRPLLLYAVPRGSSLEGQKDMLDYLDTHAIDYVIFSSAEELAAAGCRAAR